MAELTIKIESRHAETGAAKVNKALDSISAKARKVEKDLKRFNATSKNSIAGFSNKTASSSKRINKDFDSIGEHARKTENDIKRFSSNSGKSTSGLVGKLSTLKGAAIASMAAMAALATVKVATAFIKIADAMSLVNDRLKLVTNSTSELNKAQEGLFNIAQGTRVSFEATADLYTRLARSTKSLGMSQTELFQITETVNQAIIVSGASATAASAALMQLGQGFASGVLRGEELNSVLEQTPRIAQAIADGLGVTVGELRALGAAGELTADKVAHALLSQKESLELEFGEMTTTVGQAWIKVTNELGRFVSATDGALSITYMLAAVLEGLASTLSKLTGFLRESYKEMKTFFEKLIDGFSIASDEIDKTKDSIEDLNKEIKETPGHMANMWEAVVGGFILMGDAIWSILVYLGKSVISTFLGIGAALTKICIDIGRSFAKLGDVIWYALTGKWGKMKEAWADLKNLPKEAGEAIMKMFNDTTKRTEADWNAMVKRITKPWSFELDIDYDAHEKDVEEVKKSLIDAEEDLSVETIKIYEETQKNKISILTEQKQLEIKLMDEKTQALAQLELNYRKDMENYAQRYEKGELSLSELLEFVNLRENVYNLDVENYKKLQNEKIRITKETQDNIDEMVTRRHYDLRKRLEYAFMDKEQKGAADIIAKWQTQIDNFVEYTRTAEAELISLAEIDRFFKAITEGMDAELEAYDAAIKETRATQLESAKQSVRDEIAVRQNFLDSLLSEDEKRTKEINNTYNSRLETLKKYFEKGKITEEQYNKASINALKRKNESIEKLTKKTTSRIEKFWGDVYDEIEDTTADLFYNILTGDLEGFTDSFEDFCKSILKQWARMIAQMALQKMFGGKANFIVSMMGGGGGQGAQGSGYSGGIQTGSFGGSSPPGSAGFFNSSGGGGNSIQQGIGIVNSAYSLSSAGLAYRAAGGGWAGIKAGLGSYFGWSSSAAASGTSAAGVSGAGVGAGIGGYSTVAALGYMGGQYIGNKFYPDYDQRYSGWGGAAGAMGGYALGGMAGTALAAGGGMMAGAAMGSIVPIIGTIIGAIIGAIAGSLLGGRKHRPHAGIAVSGVSWSPVEQGFVYGDERDYPDRTDQKSESGIAWAYREDAKTPKGLADAVESAFENLLESWSNMFEHMSEMMGEAGKVWLSDLDIDVEFTQTGRRITKQKHLRYLVSSWSNDIYRAAYDDIVEGLGLIETETKSALSKISPYLKEKWAKDMERLIGDVPDLDPKGKAEDELKKIEEYLKNVEAVNKYIEIISSVMAEVDFILEFYGESDALKQSAKALFQVNKQFDDLAIQLSSAGVDLEKYTQLEEARGIVIAETTQSMVASGMSASDIQKAIDYMAKSMSEAGKTVEEVATAILAAARGLWQGIQELMEMSETYGQTQAEIMTAKYGRDFNNMTYDDWYTINEQLHADFEAQKDTGYSTFEEYMKHAMGWTEEMIADWGKLGAELWAGLDEAAKEGERQITTAGKLLADSLNEVRYGLYSAEKAAELRAADEAAAQADAEKKAKEEAEDATTSPSEDASTDNTKASEEASANTVEASVKVKDNLIFGGETVKASMVAGANAMIEAVNRISSMQVSGVTEAASGGIPTYSLTGGALPGVKLPLNDNYKLKAEMPDSAKSHDIVIPVKIITAEGKVLKEEIIKSTLSEIKSRSVRREFVIHADGIKNRS